jgi:SPP1 family predicted phage head-tail adaptor
VEAGSVWASWLPQSGREFTAAQARHSEATGIFRIRHRTDLDPTWQIVQGDDLFGIVAVLEVGRREYLDLIVKATDQSPGSSLSVLQLEGTDAASFLLLEDSTPLLMEAAS